MFELGARPYPPREVYQQYLAQSDVFIGLYWQRYGQPAPGMQVSGLEEEFDLSGSRRGSAHRSAGMTVHLGVTMCHYDEAVRSVADSAAGRLTARRSWFQSARYRAAPATRAARAAIVPSTTTRPSAAAGKARR